MPKLDTFTVKIQTGEQGRSETPRYSINGFKLDFEQHTGNTEAQGEFVATGEPLSFPHTLLLLGPEEGETPWAINGLEVTYHCAGEEPYTVHLGAVTLEDDSDLNIWHERPPEVFDV